MGFVELLPDSANMATPGNGGHRNPARILPDAAPQLFDAMPGRTSCRSPAISVPLVLGEIWERGPEVLERDGSAIHAIFSQTLPSDGCTEPTVPANYNAGIPRRSGATSPPLGDLDARAIELGGGGQAPTHAGRAAGLLASYSRTVLSGQQPVLGQIQRSTTSQPGDLEGSNSAPRLPNSSHFTAGREGGEGRADRLITGGAKKAHIWADSSLSDPDLEHNVDATVFASDGRRPRGQGVMKAGQLGSGSTEVRGETGVTLHNVGQMKEGTQLCATQHRQTDNDANPRNLAVDQTSAWGRPPGPSQHFT